MRRSPLLMSIVLLVLAAEHNAHCIPPDQVTGSPVPPLQKAVQQPKKNTWTGESKYVEPASWTAIPSRKTAQRNKHPAKATVDAQSDGAEYADDYQDLRNSREMQDARATVLEFCRRAKQSSLEEGEQFLAELEKLSYEQQLDWLRRYLARKQSALRNQQQDALTRRIGVEQSLNRIEANRRSAENVAELRRRAAESRPSYFISKPFGLLPSLGVNGLTRNFGFEYDPLEAVVDPASPRGYDRKVAAAMSLPGDLPRGDQRNFIRGEEGVDFGESANPIAVPVPAAPGPAVGVPPSVPVPVSAPE